MLSGRCTALYSLAMVHVQPGHSAQAAPVPDVLGTRGAGAALPVSFKLGLNIKPATGTQPSRLCICMQAYAVRRPPPHPNATPQVLPVHWQSVSPEQCCHQNIIQH